jgi:2-oxoglutarate dehydrogenase E2 component (dihydrolipoamide succinyltransferase)
VNTVVAVLDGAAAQPAAEPTAAKEDEAPAPVAQEAEAPAEAAKTVEPEPAPEQPNEPAPEQPQEPRPQVVQPQAPAPPPAAVAAHKTEVKPLHRRSDAPAAPGNGSPTAEELRRTKSSPLVRKIAEEHGIDVKQLEGTGMSGRVTKNDILSYIESGTVPQRTVAPAFHAGWRKPATSFRTAARASTQPQTGDRVGDERHAEDAEHMVLSRRLSAVTSTVYEIDMSKVAKLRDENRKAFEERTGTKLTFMPFIFKAVTDAIRKFPIFNSQVTGDQIIYKRDINLGMAVALDWGLIVPVIKRADDLSISGLARAANDLADRARTKQLKPDEVAGGTFTITNPGVFGGLFGTPIINQPQVAILGVGKIEKRTKVLTSADGEDYVAIRSMAYFALSFDHRIIDGADAERFLAYLKQHLENAQFAI